MSDARIVVASINIGHAAPIEVGGKMIQTGFYKQSVAGPVAVTEEGVAGDEIADRSRHGGPDQAVYLFGAEDTAWWAAELQRDIPHGYFGENLTLDRFWPDVRVGDRLHIGSLVLEVSFPRIPCATLAARVGDVQFLKTFVAANRAGVYTRVIQPGVIASGESASLVRAPPAYPSVESLFELWHSNPRDKQQVRQALEAPIAARGRSAMEKWVAAGSA